MTDFTHGALAHFDIAGADAAKTGAFYADLFGWTVDLKGPGYALVTTPDGGPNGAVMEAEAPGLTLGMAVTDLDEMLSRVIAAGGTVVMPATDNGWVKKAQIGDPDGNTVTLIEI
ncbi:MAG: VOC family protein [Pseudomonadota bacterium]